MRFGCLSALRLLSSISTPTGQSGSCRSITGRSYSSKSRVLPTCLVRCSSVPRTSCAPVGGLRYYLSACSRLVASGALAPKNDLWSAPVSLLEPMESTLTYMTHLGGLIVTTITRRCYVQKC